MDGKFMKLKKLIIPVMTLVILTSQLAGCAMASSKEMLNMLNNGNTIVIEMAVPEGEELNIESNELEWTQLDQLKTFNNGFRQSFDEIFNINIVSEQGVNGKSGSLYVDEEGDRNGNATLMKAFRNKAFVEKYWGSTDVKGELAKISSQAYEDTDENKENSVLASINAYYNLIGEGEQTKFKGDKSLTREQFYTLMYRSEEGVKPIDLDSNYIKSVGSETIYTKFAQEIDEFAFLNASNDSLDESTSDGIISRAEVIYMIVNKHFGDKLEKVTGKEKAFKDTKNGGDIALKLGFKEKDKESGTITAKEKWQSYTLAFIMQYPDKGLQEELYKAMVVAKQVGLIEGSESNWDEPISKAESIEMLINTYLIENKEYGYLSEVEYGNINIDKFTIASGGSKAIGIDEETGLEYGDDWVEVEESTIPLDGNTLLDNGMTLGEVKELIDMQRGINKQQGITGKEETELLRELAKELGTTLEDVDRVIVAETPVVQEPAVQTPVADNGNSGEGSAPSGNTGGTYSGNTGGTSSPITNWDKDGNGISDSFDGNYGGGGEGSTESSPHWNVQTP